MVVSTLFLAHDGAYPPTCLILPLDAYHGVSTVLRGVLSCYGFEVSRVDMMDCEAVARELTSARRTGRGGGGGNVIVWVDSQ